MHRRAFIGTLAAATTVSLGDGVVETAAAAETIEPLVFDSTASLLDSNDDELADESVVAVWAEDTATNSDSDGDGDGVIYGDESSIPLVAVDAGVVGFGSMLVEDETNWQAGNEEFLLNVFDAEVGTGTVLWDEGHGQYYTLSKFSQFHAYAEENGYDVAATTSLTDDLSDADAAVVTSPGTAFTDEELDALSTFVDDGGTLLLFDQSDYGNYDETANLNDVVGSLGRGFRFNDDEVVDDIENGGQPYQPRTDEFGTEFDYFAAREGLGLDPEETYTVPVTDVIDGDTVKVDLDGTVENIRVLGLDTPETSGNSQYEQIREWEGIEDTAYLEAWADEATNFGVDELADETVDLTFDTEEPTRDAFGRILGYIYYDAGSGARDTLYNRRCVEEGLARVYDSGFSKHTAFRAAEEAARSDGTGLWAESDPEDTSEIRNRAVDDLFFPKAASVRTTTGAVDDARVPVVAESTATQEGGDVAYDRIPLVGVDDDARVALVGGELVDESYESEEGFAVDTSTYENFVFVTNLLDSLSATTGDVLVDGGRGQFGASYGLSAEDAAYYLRFLEGVGIGFEGVNEFTAETLSSARALLLSTPADALSDEELDALSSFRDDGGSVVLVGTGWTGSEGRDNLNAVADALGTDLRLSADRVTDESNNLDGDAELPTTTAFDTSFDLFSAYDGSSSGDDDENGELVVAEIHEDAEGNDYDNLNDEYVVFENVGESPLDLTDWQVKDEVDKTYTFPTFTLDAGAQVTLYTGSGTDTDTELYWGQSAPVWNNSGDTVYVYDDTGVLMIAESY
ncbi:DUF4350 domain-containing protein [Haloprofundus halobius]|uniref:DUF4350 domain-containing protein n=1 Tax=Haloprofundus halobius TaxID=2876194 RepID=UPI001CCBDD60|nr:DUF4350 domain-containing protein [Haloprofundus halobius]